MYFFVYKDACNVSIKFCVILYYARYNSYSRGECKQSMKKTRIDPEGGLSDFKHNSENKREKIEINTNSM